MSDTENDATLTRETRSNSKVFIHVPPRIDQEFYQAEIPYVYHGPKPAQDISLDWCDGPQEIHSTDHEEVKKNFLLFTRNIYERSYHSNLLWTNNLMSTPLHTDEHALEFLSLHKYEIQKAKFFLCTILSGGKAIQHVRKIRQKINQLNSSNKMTEKLQILFYENESRKIHGSYEANEMTRRNYTIEAVRHEDELQEQQQLLLQQPTPTSTSSTTTSGGGGGASSSTRKNKKRGVDNNLNGSENSSPSLENDQIEENEGGENTNDRHRTKADKQERKKKWLAIHKTLTNLQNSINPGAGYARPTLISLHECFEQAYRTLPAPSDVLLGEAMEESLQEMFQFLLEKYLMSKEWIANVYDAFSRSRSENLDLKRLQTLLNEGERLSFRCVLEETQLRRSLRDIESIVEMGRQILDKVSDSAVTESSKIPFFELNDLLMFLKPFESMSNIFLPSDLKTFQDLYDQTVALNETTEFIIHRAAMPRIKRACLTRVSVDEIDELWSKIAAHPITVYGSNDIKAIRDVGAQWREQAARVCADGAPLVSMTKLETLINTGEKLPLDFPEELEILRNKRLQAKQWLEKFGKSVSATASSRHTRKSEGRASSNGGLPLMNVSLGEKINLEDMKKMVLQGEQLCEERKSKELVRAINVLDTAEEWIDRVRDFLRDGAEADVDSLQELLDETEGMPVAMVEADLLRSHIEALQWAEKAKPVLDKQKLKLSTLQRLSRDISKIRGMISPEYAEQYAVNLPEEIKLNEILASYQRWQDSYKKLVHGGSVKSGVTLKAIQKLVEECDAIQVDLESESKHIRGVVAEATEWIESFAETLEALQIPITSINYTPSSSKEDETTPSLIDYAELKNLIDSAHHLTVQFPELIAAVKRWSDVQYWLDQVESKCPKRHGKKSRNPNSIQTSELLELVQFAQELHVSFPDELKRLHEVIERSMAWEQTCEKNIFEILTLIQTVVNTCRDGLTNLPQLLIKFNFLIGTNQQLDYNQYNDLGVITEEEINSFFHLPVYTPSHQTVDAPWDFVEKSLLPMIEILIQGGEEAGSITTQGLLILACLKVVNWMIVVKSKLTSPDWGNASRGEIINLLNEARLAVPAERSIREFDELYQHTILASSTPLFLSDDEIKTEETIQTTRPVEQITSPTLKKDKRGRKKELKSEKFDDISEVDSKEAIEEIQIEEVEETGRKKRGKAGRGKRIFFGDEEISVTDDLKSNKKRSRDGVDETHTTTTTGTKKKFKQSHNEDNDFDVDDNSETAVSISHPPPPSAAPSTSSTKIYFDLTNPHTTTLPLPVVMLVDLWIRWLILFLKRMNEIEIWKTHSFQIIANSLTSAATRKGVVNKSTKKMLTRDHQPTNQITAKDWATVVLKSEDEPSVLKLLEWAKLRNLNCSSRKLIERRYQNSLEWCNKVNGILHNKACRLSLEDTQLIIKENDDSLLIIYQDLILALKENIKKAKIFTNKLEKTLEQGSSQTLVPISTKELEEILPETENICIDLSLQINAVLQHTKVYCLCREASHGMMLGCDRCEDWCHVSCIGLTKTQADRVDTYICVRCSIMMSFHATYAQISAIVNSWMNPEEAVTQLENKRQRVLKRILKEEKDIIKLNEELAAIIQSKAYQQQHVEQILSSVSMPSPLTSEDSSTTGMSVGGAVPVAPSSAASNASGSPATTASTTLVNTSQSHDPHTQQHTSLLPPHQQQQNQQQQHHLQHQQQPFLSTPTLLNQLPLDTGLLISNLEKKEKAIKTEIDSLLLKLSRIKAEEEEILSFFTLNVQQRYQLNEWMVTIQSLLWPKTKEEEDAGRPSLQSLPSGFLQSLECIVPAGLDKIHDVRVIVDGFKWMTWCYQCLSALRIPPTTKQLKKLLDFAGICKMADEKIVKILAGISLRATQWKIKARKFLGIVGPPSMKGHHYSTKSIDVAKAKALLLEGNMSPLRSRLKDILRESIIQAEASSSKETNSGRRKAAVESVVGHGVNNLSSTQTLTFNLEEYPPYSSDEEDNADGSTGSSSLPSSTSSSSSGIKSKREYASYSSLQMAPPIDNIWPPKQTISRTQFRTYNPSYRHVFLTITPRDESSLFTNDPVTVMNEALKKKRKLCDGELIPTNRSIEAGKSISKQPSQQSTQQSSSSSTTTSSTSSSSSPQSLVKNGSSSTSSSSPPPRGQLAVRPNYHFPPRPTSLPPGTIIRGGVVQNPPGVPPARPFILPNRSHLQTFNSDQNNKSQFTNTTTQTSIPSTQNEIEKTLESNPE